MIGLTLPTACLCLTAGVLLGGLFLFFKLLRGLLCGGRLMEAALDVLFCLIWALVSFLCALVVDKGRMRMFQAVLQALGAWGAVVALDPFISGITSLARRLGRRLRMWLGRPVRSLRGRYRAGKAAILAKRRKRKGAHKKKGKRAKARGPGGRSAPRYREIPAKSKRYAPKTKKNKNPLEKLT